MPIAATSDIEIAQRACIMAGIAKIDSFEDASNEVAIVLNDLYEDTIRDCLSIHPWRFACFEVVLGPPLGATPLVGYSAAYALPNDPAPLQIKTLYVGGSLAPRYTIMREQLWVDAQPTDELVLDALWRINETGWPPYFTLYAILRLAGFLAGAITRNGALAKTLLDEGNNQLVRSRTRDSQQQTTLKLRMTKIRSTRLGGRPM
jgi:hypothetical protein